MSAAPGPRDAHGNPVSLGDPASLARVDDFVAGFVMCEARAVRILEAAAHDASTTVQAYAAALHMFAESADGPANARPFIGRALESQSRASPRERRFAAAVKAWVDGDVAGAIRLHEEQAREHPRDLVSVKLGQYHCFNLGDSPGMLRLALAVRDACADVPQVHGMAAFGFEQCHLLDHAERAARRALEMTAREPWAQHALAHVMLTQGRVDEGRAFMEAASPRWTGLNSFMVTHNWWHLALFLIEQGDGAGALALYDREVWGVEKGYSQDQIGAVSLLARLELAGVDVGGRWDDVASYLAARVDEHVQPFLDLQYLYGLARAGRAEADRMLASIEAHATRAPRPVRGAWQRVCVPAARGLLAYARGDDETAIDALGTALPRMAEVGGSHAQRDIFEQVWLGALMRAGRWPAAQNLLQPRANAHPQSVRLRRQLDDAYRALGLAPIPAPDAAP